MQQDFITGIRFMGGVIFIILAIFVVLANRKGVQSDVYNRSRLLFAFGSLMLGTHNFIQFFGHYRESSVTTACAINMLFYILVLNAYNLGELNLLRAGLRMKSKYWHAVGFSIACILLFFTGLLTDTLVNDEKPWMTMTFAMSLIYLDCLIWVNWRLEVTLREVRKHIEQSDVELVEQYKALKYTANSIRWIMIASLITPFCSISTSVVFNGVVGLVIFVLFVWHQCKFIIYGYNMSDVIEVENDIYSNKEEKRESFTKRNNHEEMSKEDQEKVAEAVSRWLKKGCYNDPTMTLQKAVTQMGITAPTLNFYIQNNTGQQGYKSWIPYLRIEEAKRLLWADENYTIDTIAEMCGFSNGSALARSFKTLVGKTPKQWKNEKFLYTDRK